MTSSPSTACFVRAIGEIIILQVVAFFGGMGPDVAPRAGPDTTVILAPLAANGLPDYKATVLGLLGRGTPPEDNVAIPLLAALWPMGIEEAELRVICREIGADDSPPAFTPIDGGYQSESMAAALSQLAGERLRESRDHDTIGIALRDAARAAPWRGDDLPPLRDWLRERATAIDVVVQSAGRTSFYLPTALLLNGDPSVLLFEALGHSPRLQRVADVLRMHAMLRLGDEETEAAWTEILALHKLARSVAGPRRCVALGSSVVADRLANAACDATLQLLDAPSLSAAEIAVIGRDLAALPPVVNRHRLMEIERLSVVAWLVHAASMPRFARVDKFDDDLQQIDGADRTLLLATSLDWNTTLRAVNAFYDDLDDGLRPATWLPRKAHATQVERDLRGAGKGPRGVANISGVVKLLVSRESRSRLVGEMVTLLLGPATIGVDTRITRSEAKVLLTRMAAALAAWRSGKGRGQYPQRLDELVPDILPKVPHDPFTNEPLVYQRRGNGYLLYSLGANGLDDGGTDDSGSIVNGEWMPDSKPHTATDGDVVIRLPIPAPAALARLQQAIRETP